LVGWVNLHKNVCVCRTGGYFYRLFRSRTSLDRTTGHRFNLVVTHKRDDRRFCGYRRFAHTGNKLFFTFDDVPWREQDKQSIRYSRQQKFPRWHFRLMTITARRGGIHTALFSLSSLFPSAIPTRVSRACALPRSPPTRINQISPSPA